MVFSISAQVKLLRFLNDKERLAARWKAFPGTPALPDPHHHGHSMIESIAIYALVIALIILYANAYKEAGLKALEHIAK